MQRSSFSPILADMLDFSNAIYDADLHLLSQAANCPVHLAAMKFSAEEAVKGIGAENIREGDVLVLNDPYRGGTHINDITFTKPIYFKRELIGYAVSRGHWMDLGPRLLRRLAGCCSPWPRFRRWRRARARMRAGRWPGSLQAADSRRTGSTPLPAP